jgi:ABC-type transport system involved in multi-copper enzyme maturation permease subunit
MKMNFKSMLVSGTVTGIVIMLVGGCLVPIIGNQMDEVLKNRLLPPISNGAMAYFAFNSIVLGIGVMGFYALVKSTIKSRLKAILTTSLLFWFFTYFLANAALVAYGFMPLGLTVIGTAWGLLELLIGVMIGSKIYKEVN